MLIFIDPNGNYPRFIGDIVLENPSWTIGNSLPPGWILVAETVPPEVTSTQILEESFPELVDGIHTQKWTVRSKTEQELALDQAAQTARQKLIDLGLTEAEINALTRGLR